MGGSELDNEEQAAMAVVKVDSGRRSNNGREGRRDDTAGADETHEEEKEERGAVEGADERDDCQHSGGGRFVRRQVECERRRLVRGAALLYRRITAVGEV